MFHSCLRVVFVSGFLLGTAGLAVSAAQQAGAAHAPERSVDWPRSARKISTRTSGLRDALDITDRFASSAVRLGDLDGDGTIEVAIGAPGSGPERSDGVVHAGCVWLVSLDAQGSVQATRRIFSDETRPSHGSSALQQAFGEALANPGDLDGDGTPELLVGAPGDDDGGPDRGAVYVLFLTPEGTVERRQKISTLEGNFGGLANLDLFGRSVAGLGDLDGDGVGDIAVGATGDDAGSAETGAVYVLLLNADGTVRTSVKHSQTSGALAGTLEAGSFFGQGVAGLGDLDQDGIPDLAVGSPLSAGGSGGEGAVRILFLRADGSVRAFQKIGESSGGFGGSLPSSVFFGTDLVTLGDIDGDSVQDLAVGAPGLGSSRGSLWVLSLATGGTVLGEQLIQSGSAGFVGPLDPNDSFGEGLGALGDLDGDGQVELLVGAPRNSLTSQARGKAWVLSLTGAGTVAAEHRIAEGESGFPLGTLESGHSFGASLAHLGDLDDDGVGDLAVGSPGAAYTTLQGVWVLRLTRAGGVAGYQEIAAGVGGLPQAALAGFFDFGRAVAGLGDLDGDGVEDLVTSALEEGGSGGTDSRLGTLFVLFLEPDGSVRSYRTIQPPRALLEEGDEVGQSLCTLGDLDGDGVVDLLAGAPGDDEVVPGVLDGGSVWVLFLNADGTLKGHQRIGTLAGGFGGTLPSGARFGSAVAAAGDVDGDGVVDAAVGAPGEDDGGANRGALYLLFLQPDGTVREYVEISTSQGLTGLVDNTGFGASLAGPGDLDGNGVPDLAVGCRGLAHDQLRVLYLGRDGSVGAQELVPPAPGRFAGTLEPFDQFGASVAAVGDRDGDGVVDLALGAPGDDDGGGEHGAVWLARMGGVACFDFSSADDALRTPLADGTAVASPAGFARTIELSATGSNLGPALFDTSAGGPNDPGPAPGLLVGLGNALVLQDSLRPTQSVAGVFDQPDDDPDGGTLRFRLRRGSVEPMRLDLIALGAGSGGASVVLVDSSGRTRTYSIPAGWTEELSLDGGPGFRTLDLTTLDAQPGFQSSATAAESPGFRPEGVVRIEVTLNGSGALDNLCWRPVIG